ncbi:glycoside hydrolase family 88 protein [Oleiharenicola lentus]|uniref:glycoside hydrolase family 88 protein n=1 Tax=Oleiharenicola lentus TaxID=2508720 RepID=UPI003F67E9F7
MKFVNSLRSLAGILLAGLIATPAIAAPAPGDKARYEGATPLEWSIKMADSEMERRGDRHFFGGSNSKARIDYTTAFLGTSLIKLTEATGQKRFAEYGAKMGESFVQADGSIATYKMEDYNIDNIPPGKVLLLGWEQGKRDAKYKKAIDTLYDQMQKHPRTTDGGYWHKLRYPNQMWLDGLFMASPFLAHYSVLFQDPAGLDEAAKQILLMDKHGYDAKNGLYRHAWSEPRDRDWADKKTGQSPNVWGRAVGWYAMAVVDSLEFFPPTHPEVEHVNEILRKIADGIVRWQDPKSGLWWQVMDQGDRKGNYLESTASSMFVYALAKGINRGFLSREKYLPAVIKGYEGIVRDFIRKEHDEKISLTQCCEVAGLDFTSKGRPRDGSFDYYISENIIDNDLKGVSAFIFAGIEIQKLITQKQAPIAARGWQDYERTLARIKAPTFPNRDFPITDFGAKPGADSDSSAAITAAIAAANQAGGGRVVVPAGSWKTGAIHLKSNVNLHVSKGATLNFSTNPKDYPIVQTRWEGVELMNYSALIYAFEQENIAVTGEGTLDGGSTTADWWSWNKKGDKPQKQKAARDRLVAMAETDTPVKDRVFGDGHFLRPNFIQPYRCKNILIEGVTILRSPMWVIHPTFSQNITVRGVTVNSHGGNNDGCDPESSSDVLIEDCVFDTGDDCIAIKSGRNGDGRRVPVPSENIIVRNCTMKDGHGGVVLGSECSAGIRNVFVENCTMDSPDLDRALRFKNNAVRGGILENVFMRNVKVGQVAEAVLTIDLLYEEGAKGAFKPIVRNVQMDNITSSASPRVMYIRGFEGAIIENIRISNSTFNGVTHTEVVQHAGSITLNNVTINPAKVVRGINSVAPPTPAAPPAPVAK